MSIPSNRCYYCASYFGWIFNRRYICNCCEKSICFNDAEISGSIVICKVAHKNVCKKNIKKTLYLNIKYKTILPLPLLFPLYIHLPLRLNF